LLVAFAWGILNLVTVIVANQVPDTTSTASSWTFGQVVAVIVLIAPLLAIVESTADVIRGKYYLVK
jgi:hypothetical protein